MKNKCNKIEQTCGTKQWASCTEFEGTPNEVSPLSDDCSISAEESLQDIYTQLEEINLSELGDTCLDYIETAEGRLIVKNVLLKFEEEICLLKEQISELQTTNVCNQNITSCDLDFGTLTNACDTPVSTLAETLQLILDNIQPTP